MSDSFSTPEGWFRTQHKDIYLLDRAKNLGRHPRDRAFDVLESDHFDIQDELLAWFAENLPAVTIKIILPSEYSGILLGADAIVADLDETSLITFCDAWKNSDAGWMVVERLSYEQWLSRIQSCRLVSAPMERLTWWSRMLSSTKVVTYSNQQQPVRWWDTPNGVRLISAAHNRKLPSCRDAWWLLQQLVPDMNGCNINDYPHGIFFPQSIGQSHHIGFDWVDDEIELWSGEQYQKDIVSMNGLLESLGVEKCDSIESTIGD
ncbi:MAG: hypothetical protein ABL920_00075 [Methylotenera sp.]